MYNKQVLICGDTGCRSSKSNIIEKEFREELRNKGLEKVISIVRVGCFGLCAAGPIAVVHPGGKFYASLKIGDAKRIIEEDLIGNKTVKDLIYEEAISEDIMKSIYEVSYYKKQLKIAHKNCGYIDPSSIEEYIAADGYFALDKVISEMTPEEVTKEIIDSGLRGRGGGGFPTGFKWELTRKSLSDKKYVICNADEGDPGAFMDRSILEGDPHSVLEAMAIAGYAIGADEGFIYIRAEYPSAVDRLNKSIDEAEKMGVLGKNIFGTDFSFNIKLKLGAGAFVCGEETALMNSIEGKRGEPNPKPPYPAESGLYGKPTLINNVETYANITRIILDGSKWFSSIGTEKSKGTKVFTLGGEINRPGIIEVPMGITLREIIYEIGGGIPGGKQFKAVQTGGPSGGCITAEDLDTPIDYDSLIEKGSMMGSGGMIVMSEDSCMVDIAKFYLEFTLEESCGKCTPCRIGNKRLQEILVKITEGKAEEKDLGDLENLAEIIKDTSLCALGQSAPNPVLSTLSRFRKEYEDHVLNKHCPAKVCNSLINYSIIDSCIGCTKCAKLCPTHCISGKVREVHVIDNSKCIKCGACYNGCPVNAIIKE
ncbi:NADH-quinone oxidoreductase subunit NuoF [Miniphocaeibacter massiliensis]|uniref:NADH-quinone oxidoreductase subunit NuoF n=1 Tax=Miniphocaeibacter massiliensis TaxID=2041841 RepID=UPI003BF4BC09